MLWGQYGIWRIDATTMNSHRRRLRYRGMSQTRTALVFRGAERMNNNYVYRKAFGRYMSIISRATDEDRSIAEQWYEDAHGIAECIARVLRVTGRNPGATIEHGAAVIAALSPRVPWVHNLRMAFDIATSGTCGGLTASRKVAIAAMTGGMPMVRGQKTAAFARAISGDMSAVTIDTWMMQAAGFKVYAPNRSNYRTLVRVVTDVSKECGMHPRDCQALIWILHRGRSI